MLYVLVYPSRKEGWVSETVDGRCGVCARFGVLWGNILGSLASTSLLCFRDAHAAKVYLEGNDDGSAVHPYDD